MINGIMHLDPSVDLDGFFAHFKVESATMVNNRVGNYPFANQRVAANAIISDVQLITLSMTCPAQTEGGYFTKAITMTALKKSLDIHIEMGGTFMILTPCYPYTNCLLTNLYQGGGGNDSKQPQNDWVWEFQQPLLTLEEAKLLQGSLLSKISGKLPVSSPSWSGLKDMANNAVSGIQGLF